MIIEHFLYNISIAILVGIFYKKYYNRNPTWIIVACAWLPDLDFILQAVCYKFYELTDILLPIMIRHGDFHNVPIIILLSFILGYVLHTKFGENFYDAAICIFIGGMAHFIADICVYAYTYYPFYPISGFAIKTIAILPETRNMFGMGDWLIFAVGACILFYCCILKFAIDGTECLNYINFHAKNAYIMCISIFQP